ncbi:hypothetical protein MEN41_09710 [Dolichospermum sp. ST_con]|nr:hypothetical protein [Dolichospermum sp. ST_con]MDD1420566.1 hypothetical protein [Dolichospermum sp. ST_sed1]MDD1426079.1 hypothetical protein [Dolichospermum sp. ST_sed9]MDD1432470.1 hypothetical protein [Dolichospermum sp. ST_sed6]MDD1435984.1 hypothetical protein [Dolichospermum sp. ST_sed10]MDD1442069.1 hypothetical protein [Dolichospermum sp. ST_sed3]MDD1447832.1 hypothetical protein [Dolichospermum sp. ST_sed8]MDD1456256.1 hypothetical protein [Dolichospermum sp. ST_sed7]MDD146197
MPTVNLCCHEFVVAISSIACILGLWLLRDCNQGIDDFQETEENLLRMSFAYWLVYCIAFGIDKVFLLDSNVIIVSLRITIALSYLLTFFCILSLPLHKFAVHKIEE